LSTHLVIGLGNPGRKYEKTRHNAGFLVVDRLASESSEALEKKQLGALVASVRLGNNPTILAKPQSFMNLSGQPTTSLRGYYKVEDDDIVVVHDDVDIPFGEVRVKSGGGHGGHNGLRDINQKLGTNCYARVRVGVGRPPEGHDTANYVLGRFSSEESSSLDELIGRAADATRAVVDGGVASAMNTFNVR
jgi:PTH1 family peptidyl-tRNA hydrolase